MNIWNDLLHSKNILQRQEEEQKIYPIRDILEVLVGYTDSDFGHYAFSREPLEGKLTEEQIDSYIVKANICGQEEASALGGERPAGQKFLEEEAAGYAVRTVYSDIAVGGGRVVFAEYAEPDRMTVYNDCVRKAEELIENEDIADLLPGLKIRNLLLSHELFHIIEVHKKDSIFTQTEKIELWKKPFTNQSRIVCLSEIAGMSFAKEMQRVQFSPYIMDVLLIYAYNRKAASGLFEEMKEIQGEKKC